MLSWKTTETALLSAMNWNIDLIRSVGWLNLKRSPFLFLVFLFYFMSKDLVHWNIGFCWLRQLERISFSIYFNLQFILRFWPIQKWQQGGKNGGLLLKIAEKFVSFIDNPTFLRTFRQKYHIQLPVYINLNRGVDTGLRYRSRQLWNVWIFRVFSWNAWIVGVIYELCALLTI
jgi:hypothetical protein